EFDVLFGVVWIAHAQLLDGAPADRFGAGFDVLHVDKSAVRFPDTFLDRARLVTLHDRVHAWAVQLIRSILASPDSLGQGVECQLESRAQLAIQMTVLKRIENHPGSIRARAY